LLTLCLALELGHDQTGIGGDREDAEAYGTVDCAGSDFVPWASGLVVFAALAHEIGTIRVAMDCHGGSAMSAADMAPNEQILWIVALAVAFAPIVFSAVQRVVRPFPD
jgi:hypothetical protein